MPSNGVSDLPKNFCVANFLQARESLSYCDQHGKELLKIYCSECELVMCTMYYIESHNGHKWSNVNDVVDDLRECMASDSDRLSAGIDRCAWRKVGKS